MSRGLRKSKADRLFFECFGVSLSPQLISNCLVLGKLRTIILVCPSAIDNKRRSFINGYDRRMKNSLKNPRSLPSPTPLSFTPPWKTAWKRQSVPIVAAFAVSHPPCYHPPLRPGWVCRMHQILLVVLQSFESMSGAILAEAIVVLTREIELSIDTRDVGLRVYDDAMFDVVVCQGIGWLPDNKRGSMGLARLL